MDKKLSHNELARKVMNEIINCNDEKFLKNDNYACSKIVSPDIFSYFIEWIQVLYPAFDWEVDNENNEHAYHTILSSSTGYKIAIHLSPTEVLCIGYFTGSPNCFTLYKLNKKELEYYDKDKKFVHTIPSKSDIKQIDEPYKLVNFHLSTNEGIRRELLHLCIDMTPVDYVFVDKGGKQNE